MNGITLISLFIAAIALMVIAISKWKVHPFIAIIFISIILAVAAGIPLGNIPGVIGKGFSSIFTSIGLVIIFGILIGSILEQSGAAVRLADSVLKVVGPKHPQLAMMLIGWIISIPVFCDSGYVILNPVRKNLAKRTGHSPVALAVALSAGLYASHVFIPPTPGPIAAAGMLGLENNILLVIGVGVLASIPALLAAYFYASYIGKRVHTKDEHVDECSTGIGLATENAPSTLASALPILLPVVLMAAGSVAAIMKPGGATASVLDFLGKPVIALAVGFLCAVPLLFSSCPECSREEKRTQFYSLAQKSLETAGPIIFITAAGSVLGSVMSEAGFVRFVQDNAPALATVGIFFPFLVAAVLKSAMGSSTVAITTTAGILGVFSDSSSLMAALGLTSPLAAAITVMSIGAGAMVVSHANDSYFWVVTNFSELSTKDGYRTQTMMTLLAGVATVITLFAVSLFVI